jgi:hypothetical protein
MVGERTIDLRPPCAIAAVVITLTSLSFVHMGTLLSRLGDHRHRRLAPLLTPEKSGKMGEMA